MYRLILVVLVPAWLSANIGTVAAFKGKVQVERSSQNLMVNSGFVIEQKDTMMTGEKSRAQIIMKDETIITVGSNSEYSFDTYNVGKEAQASMELKRGFFRAITGKIGKIAPNRFKIKTRSATIGIRGTHLGAEVMQDVEKIWCFKGRITVKTPEKLFEIPAGKMIIFQQGIWRILPATDHEFKLQPPSRKLNRHQNLIQEKPLSTDPSTIPLDPPPTIPFDPDH